MEGEPCLECGGTDLKLIDGFYYCVECGTQNMNVRETVVEQRAFGDGTFALTTKRKIVKLQDNKIQMSGEWYKWHAYNFIISGLADELVAVGAKPSFKIKLLWIWTRYIKKYQNKEDLGLAKKSQNENNENITLPSFMFEESSTSNAVEEDGQEKEIEIEETAKKSSNKNVIMEGSKRDIRFLSRSLIIAMLYVALNLDESDIQLSHIYKFLKDNCIDISNLQRFVPEDIHVKSIPQWTNFLHSKLCNMHQMRALALSLLRKLNLGTPKVPDLRNIVDNYLTELCLPSDLKPLIYSLMHFHRCDFLDINNRTKETLIRLPDYEGVVMSYVLVAIKMCFGLDSDYEVKLSNIVDKINEDRDLSKSHRIGKYSEPSSRLFSFREWCSYMQFRKIMLCKCCLRMADQHNLDIDDYVYLEHMKERPTNKKELQDETAMDLLKKIPEEDEGRVIPKELFIPTLTPMSEYTDIIIEHSQDQETRFLLSEDFTQYSLKYACEYLELKDINSENAINGVSEHRKTINKLILGTIVTKKTKSEMVYVKNCENKNWMITNPPTMEHVTCVDSHNLSNDKESDLGYDSENASNDKGINKDTESNIIVEEPIKEDKKQVIVPEEDNDKNIFDDDFEELDIKDDLEQNVIDNLNENNENPPSQNSNFPNDDLDRISVASDNAIEYPTFDPNTFDRERAIKELMLHACKKYKIPIPAEYRIKEPRKRKIDTGNEAGTSTPTKRNRTKHGENKKKVEELLTNYYTYMHSDLLTKMQQEVSLAIRNTQLGEVLNLSQNNTDNQTTNPVNVTISEAPEKSSLYSENTDNPSNINLNSTLEQNHNLDVTNKTDMTDKTVSETEENLESTLFEQEEEIKLDDLIPKGDPKFDEEKYDTKQLYIKIKIDEEDIFDLQDDPKLAEILDRKIEECKNSTEFSKLKADRVVDCVKTKYESDSEDELPLSDIQEEKKMIEKMLAREENFDHLINKEIPEFKYWFRHYDTDFMSRSLDWHEKFDEELKENTPASFYFVIKECAAILNCTTFYLYKQMQNFEQYILSRAKDPG